MNKNIQSSKRQIDDFKTVYEGFSFTNDLIFMVRQKRASVDLELDVNFDSDAIDKVKEMRN